MPRQINKERERYLQNPQKETEHSIFRKPRVCQGTGVHSVCQDLARLKLYSPAMGCGICPLEKIEPVTCCKHGVLVMVQARNIWHIEMANLRRVYKEIMFKGVGSVEGNHKEACCHS